MNNLTFSKKLRALRKKKRLSQDDMVALISERTGKSFGRSTISNYENEVSTPGLDVIPHIAKILGVSIDELLNGEPLKENESSNKGAGTDSAYPEYVQQGSDAVYEDAVSYGYKQDELIITIREQMDTMERIVHSCQNEQ
ncbi:MAG: helix-turn-helix transcriptional regulator, partial [Bacteroidota bacterium]